MSTQLSIHTIAESDYPLWNQFVSNSPSGSIYALPAYLEVLCRVTNARFSIVGVFKGSELVGGMPLYFSRFGPGWITSNRLLLNYHSPVMREYSTSNPFERTSRRLAILHALQSHLRSVDCFHLQLQIRHPIEDVRPFLSAVWEVRLNYSYVVDIADLQAAWGRVHQNLRRLVDRATKQGLTLTDDADFESFYRLHIDTHRRKGAPIYLKEAAFRRYILALQAQNLCRLYHARLPDGTSVAAQLVLTGTHPVTHTVCAGADPAHLALGSTPFLRWKAFESLSALGFTGNDLTDAALSDVTRFKGQLGGELVLNWIVTRTGNRLFRLYRATSQQTQRIENLVKRLR